MIEFIISALLALHGLLWVEAELAADVLGSSRFSMRCNRTDAKLLDASGAADYPGRMPMTIEQLAEEALSLPSEERALLADRLVESLDAEAVNRVDRLWAAEAKRRRDEVRQGLQTIPGAEALARVRRSLGHEV